MIMDDIIIPEHKKLNLGCGFKKMFDHWNVDIEKKCNPDQVLDLEQFPYPFPDNYFEEINADNILEHLGQTPKVFTDVMKELYRISDNNAKWRVVFPHHRSDLYFDDYTHVRALTAKTFRMFDQKVNFESVAKKVSDSTFGLYHDIDIEITDVKYNITGLFQEQLDGGMLGYRKLDYKLNTVCNVCETVIVSLKVHKPGRYSNWFKTVSL